MLIICPTCGTSYNLSAESLGARGRSVRCIRCQTVWHAEAPREAKLLAAVGVEPTEPGDFADSTGADGLDLENAPSPQDIPTGQHGSAARYETFNDGARIDEQDQDTFGSVATESQLDDYEAPPIAPVDLDQVQPLRVVGSADATEVEAASDADAVEDVETLASLRSRRKARNWHLNWPLSGLQTAMLALIVFDAALIGWRSDVVRMLPQTASLYRLVGMPVNLRGLDFDSVVTTTEQHEGVPVLVVEGNVVNVARKPIEVPRLKFLVRNSTGNEIYSWTMVPPRTVLPAGETLSFRSRLASPPPEGRDVLVRFFARRDLVAGVR